MVYRFLQFQLDPSRRTLFSGGEEITVPNKAFKFLLELVENAGEVVPRQSLEAVVWDGRPISESTLYQMVTRVRALLEDNDESKPIIQTVHGEGYRFVPEVHLYAEEQQLEDEHSPSSGSVTGHGFGRWLSLTAVVVLIAVVAFKFRSTDSVSGDQQPEISVPQIKLALLPANLSQIEPSQDKANWLFEGGMFYLAELFTTKKRLESQSPRKAWLEAENKTALAIDLISSDEAEIAVLADFDKNGQQYLSIVQLRNHDGVLSDQGFSSLSIRDLMQQISDWIHLQLLETAADSSPATLSRAHADLSEDEFAVESFIRGMASQLRGDSGKAIQFFQVATEQDPGFLVAWYELAVAERKQGNYQRSLAILATLKQKPTDLSVRIHNATGIAYWRLGDYENARAAYTEGLGHARKQDHYHGIRSVLTNIAILSLELDDTDTARDALDEALTLTRSQDDPYSYGTIMNTYARLEGQSGNVVQAIERSRQAIDGFSRAGERRFEASAKSRLSSFLIDQGNFQEAEVLARQTLESRKQLNHISGMLSSYLKLADVMVATGRFDAAVEDWNRALELNLQVKNRRVQSGIYAGLADLHMTTGELQPSSEYIVLQEELSEELQLDRLVNRSLILKFRHALVSRDIERAEQLLTEMDINTNAEVQMYLGDLYLLKEELAQAESAYLRSLQLLGQRASNQTMANIHNRLTALYLRYDRDKAEQSIRATRQHNPFAYPFLKYRAMLAHGDGQVIEAIALLEELKLKANDFWQAEDQQLLEQYRREL